MGAKQDPTTPMHAVCIEATYEPEPGRPRHIKVCFADDQPLELLVAIIRALAGMEPEEAARTLRDLGVRTA